MNERGHYGNGARSHAPYVGQEASKPKDSSLSGLIVPGAIFAGIAILFGRFAVLEAREMKDVERELRRERERQRFLDLPDREAVALAKEIGWKPGREAGWREEQNRALDAYLAKKG